MVGQLAGQVPGNGDSATKLERVTALLLDAIAMLNEEIEHRKDRETGDQDDHATGDDRTG